MKTGLFFGTFDPIHLGHKRIAEAVFAANIVDQIWFVVTPESPFKKNKLISSKKHRIEMVKLALQKEPNFSASLIEFDLSPPYYTAQTLRHITQKHPSHRFIIIMGSDNYSNIHRWHDSEYILNNFKICIYNREGYGYRFIKNSTQITGAHIDVSSSYIRAHISAKSTKDLLDQKVFLYIKNNFLYQ